MQLDAFKWWEKIVLINEVLLGNCETSQDLFKLHIDGSEQYIT